MKINKSITYNKERKNFRKKYQRYKQTKDINCLATETTPDKKIPKKKVKQKVPRVSIPIDASVFLVLLQQLLIEQKITKQQVLDIIDKIPDGTFVSPFKLNKEATKKDCKVYWLYLMRHHKLFCDICGNLITELNGQMKLSYDHIYPESKGGQTDGENGSPAHSLCNGLKGSHTPQEWEIVGYNILKKHGIYVDLNHTIYKYKQIKAKNR